MLLVLLAGAGLRCRGRALAGRGRAGLRLDARRGRRRPGRTPTRPAVNGRPVTVQLAFAGDVHFAGTSAAALTRGLGTRRRAAAPRPTSRSSTSRPRSPTAASGRPKQFTFRAPPQALQVLEAAGIDAVSLANNHGLDFGAARAGRHARPPAGPTGLPVIGAGVDAAAAFHGLVRTVRGVRVAVVSATDVLDSAVGGRLDGRPGPPRAGLGQGRRPAGRSGSGSSAPGRRGRRVPALGRRAAGLPDRAAAGRSPGQLVAAGADVVVGSHAHVLQPLAPSAACPWPTAWATSSSTPGAAAAVRLRRPAGGRHARCPDRVRAGHPVATTRWAAGDHRAVAGRSPSRPAPANALRPLGAAEPADAPGPGEANDIGVISPYDGARPTSGRLSAWRSFHGRRADRGQRGRRTTPRSCRRATARSWPSSASGGSTPAPRSRPSASCSTCRPPATTRCSTP